MPPLTILVGGIIFSYYLAVRPSVNAYSAWRYISLHSAEISLKLDTNIHRMSGHCWKGFQGQRSKVKVTTEQINL